MRSDPPPGTRDTVCTVNVKFVYRPKPGLLVTTSVMSSSGKTVQPSPTNSSRPLGTIVLATTLKRFRPSEGVSSALVQFCTKNSKTGPSMSGRPPKSGSSFVSTTSLIGCLYTRQTIHSGSLVTPAIKAFMPKSSSNTFLKIIGSWSMQRPSATPPNRKPGGGLMVIVCFGANGAAVRNKKRNTVLFSPTCDNVSTWMKLTRW
mmetsp:Transcript_30333/g.91825  ORF Transcript_30333/g.91825 Transcript_30333/m.91825 type:complete len:203 (-) Transcript_30333:3868-4476(-)